MCDKGNRTKNKEVKEMLETRLASETERQLIRVNIVNRLKLQMSAAGRSLKRDKYLYLLLLPFIVWYLLFQYKPMYGLQIAFKEFSLFKGIEGSPWVGLANFERYFQSEYFWRTLKNTLVINIYSLLFAFPLPILLAIMLNEVRNLLFKKSIQTLTYLPHFISIVVVAGIVTNFLSPSSGIINIIIEKLGGEKIYFLTKPEYFRAIFIFSTEIWKETGFGAIVYLAALSGISPHLYEAAVMDGAGKLKQIWYVTLPGIAPTIVIMLILKIGNMLEVGYEAVLLLYQPVTYPVADVISTYVYRAGLQGGEYALATAVGLFNGIIGLILVCVANAVSRRLTQSGLW